MNHQPGLSLDTPTQPNPPARPQYDDEAVVRAAAEKFMPEVIKWLGRDWKDEQADETKDDLIEAIEHDPDGYERAKVLDSLGWEPDAYLVEILDQDHQSVALAEALKAWVEANGIKPRFEVGDRVAYNQTDGIVVWIDHDRARYTVQPDDWLESFPHFRDQRSGFLVDFEDCREVTL